MTDWTASDIPSQKGRTAVVTGTGGLGFEDALALACAGAEVIIAGRNHDKGAEAVAKVLAASPSAAVRFEQLDLASLASVEAFAARLRDQTDRLDLLINNAAVMTPPTRQLTADGFETQLGTNYLGHFALTARLLPLLRKGKDARVVTLSSVAAREGAIDFDDLQSERGYQPMKAYGQSKLACLMFAFEMRRRSDAGRWGVASLAAHPGISRTDLLHNAPGRRSAAGLAHGAEGFVGGDRAHATRSIDAAFAQPASVTLALSVERHADAVTARYRVVGAPPGAEVVVAWVEHLREVDVRRGENAGRRLRHANVVRVWATLLLAADGAGEQTLRVPDREPPGGAEVIAWVQAPTRRVIAAARATP